MSTLCVIQARMGSTRLPGKVVADVGGRPLLGFMLERLRGLPADVVVATSDLPQDDPVRDAAAAAGVPVVRGSERDVLDRFALALRTFPCAVVVRLTADCPLMDPAIVTDALAALESSGADYVSNAQVRTFPDGLDVEVLTAAALEAAAKAAVEPGEREHVTPFVYRRPERFALAHFTSGELLGDERWTVDTEADLAFVRGVIDQLGGATDFGWRDVLAIAPPAPRTGRRLVPSPTSTPGHRRWDAVDGDRRLGAADLVFHDGRGTATVTSADLADLVTAAIGPDAAVTTYAPAT